MDEPGNPTDLQQALHNWLQQAHSPYGTLLPVGIDPNRWVVKQFINYWEKPARGAIRSLEKSLSRVRALCDTGGDPQAIRDEIDLAFQIIGEDLRQALGLYEWNEVDPEHVDY